MITARELHKYRDLLSARASNGILNCGCTSIKEMLGMDPRDLRIKLSRTPGVGLATVNEIMSFITERLEAGNNIQAQLFAEAIDLIIEAAQGEIRIMQNLDDYTRARQLKAVEVASGQLHACRVRLNQLKAALIQNYKEIL